ncbi:MAG: hypothetical protein RIB86_19550, partial [Imperialibacter sp.]
PDLKKLMFFSDCVVWAYPIDRSFEENYFYFLQELIGAMNLLVSVLINKGVLVRGGVSDGDIYIDGKKVFGPALVRSYELEKSAVYPQIVCDRSLINASKLSFSEYHKDFIEDYISENEESDFYSIDYFKMIDQAAKTFAEAQETIGYDIDFTREYIEDVVRILPNGINSADSRVRMKYEWLRSKLLTLKNAEYEFSVLDDPKFSKGD